MDLIEDLCFHSNRPVINLMENAMSSFQDNKTIDRVKKKNEMQEL